MRCPDGHASLQDNEGPTVHCGTYNEGYHYVELMDVIEPYLDAPSEDVIDSAFAEIEVYNRLSSYSSKVSSDCS